MFLEMFDRHLIAVEEQKMMLDTHFEQDSDRLLCKMVAAVKVLYMFEAEQKVVEQQS